MLKHYWGLVHSKSPIEMLAFIQILPVFQRHLMHRKRMPDVHGNRSPLIWTLNLSEAPSWFGQMKFYVFLSSKTGAPFSGPSRWRCTEIVPFMYFLWLQIQSAVSETSFLVQGEIKLQISTGTGESTAMDIGTVSQASGLTHAPAQKLFGHSFLIMILIFNIPNWRVGCRCSIATLKNRAKRKRQSIRPSVWRSP